MRVAAYYRVSSSQQREQNTIAAQRTEVRALVAARGWQLVAEHEDDGRSARSGLAKREGLAAVLGLARHGKIDALVTVALDRLTRAENLRERFAIIGEMQDARVLLIESGGGKIDLSTFEGRLVAATKLELAAEESAEKSRRARRGQARAVAENRPPCRPPWGLSYSSESGWHHTAAADHVREAAERVASGESAAAVALDWHRRGVATPSRRGRWTNGQLCRLLGDDAYVGRWEARKGHVVTVPPILEAELAAAARAALQRHQTAPLRRTRHEYLLEGILRCDLCQAPISISATHTRTANGPVLYRYYRCSSRKHAARDGRGCTLRMFRVDDVDGRAWQAVVDYLAAPGLVEEGLALRGGAATEAGERARADLEEARRRLAQQEQAADAITRALESGDLPPAVYAERIAAIGKRRRLLEQQVSTWTEAEASAASERVEAGAVEAALGELRQRAAAATFAERRLITIRVCPGGWVIKANGQIEAEASFCAGATRGSASVTREHVFTAVRLLVA